MKTFLRENMMIVVSTIAMRINKRYISISHTNNIDQKEFDE